MLVLLRKNLRLLAAALITLMTLAAGPLAHAAQPAPMAGQAAHQEMTGAGPHHMPHMAQAAPSQAPLHDHGNANCCEDIGLCGFTAVTAGTFAFASIAPQRSTSPAILDSLAGLYDPGLDLPPPRLL